MAHKEGHIDQVVTPRLSRSDYIRAAAVIIEASNSREEAEMLLDMLGVPDGYSK